MKKSVLIVSYTFPPYNGIGGRRWAKFAKYLKRYGNTVKIISAKNINLKNSPWIADIEDIKDDVFYIASCYPKCLSRYPETLLEKLCYRASVNYVKLFSKGNYYDKSLFWKRNLLQHVDKIISEFDIQNLICTVAPFRMSYDLLFLKKKFPKLNYIVDYRDPWTNNKTAYGFTSLKLKRYNFEVQLEKKVLMESDKITAVSSEMFDYLRQLCPECINEKFVLLPNGFDEDDFINIPQKNEFISGDHKSINLVFTGTLYQKAIPVFNFFLKTLEEINNESEFNISLYMAGNIPEEAKIQNTHHFVNFLPFLPIKDAYSLIKNADYTLLFLTDDLNYSRSTKFYEYVGLGKKIWVISKFDGPTAQYVENNNIGLGLNEYNMKHKILHYLKYKHDSYNADYFQTDVYKKFSINVLTKELLGLLK